MSKILIIEDEVAIADLEKDYLELSGFEVEIETRGDRGLNAAMQKDFDLIVLDLMLPGIDGFDVCRKIREKKDVPILMVSAKKDDIDKIRGLGLGADDYMTKPFSPSELVARVNAQLRVEVAVKDSLEFGDIVLDYKTPAVESKKSGESIKINNKEFQLLEYFMMNPNQVLSREMIFDRVWGMENDSMSNNLEAYMSFVRKKLKLLESSVTIKSIRNMGYRMETIDEGTK